MNPINKYIEHKTAEHTDRANAWIARVWTSASGKTVYFNSMALKRGRGSDSNHYAVDSREEYWITGVKKRGSNRHWGGTSPVQIEQSLTQWYADYTQGKGHQKLIVIPDLPMPDITKFNEMENSKIDRHE